MFLALGARRGAREGAARLGGGENTRRTARRVGCYRQYRIKVGGKMLLVKKKCSYLKFWKDATRKLTKATRRWKELNKRRIIVVKRYSDREGVKYEYKIKRKGKKKHKGSR